MSDRVWFKLADGTEIYVNVPLLVPELEADEPADADQLHNVNSFFQTTAVRLSKVDVPLTACFQT
jgi:hypothetical protein